MAILYFSDILEKVGLDPSNVKLIRHSKSDDKFRACADAGIIFEYTMHQKKDFSKGFEYWCVFIEEGLKARLYKTYKVLGFNPDTPDRVPYGLSEIEADQYQGKSAVFQLEELDILKEYESRLVIEWKSTVVFAQKGTIKKPVIAIENASKIPFVGFENFIKSYDELSEIIEDDWTYSEWHAAFKSVYAVYLIVDTENGKQYVGSASGNDGLFGRWSCYVATQHGGNKLMKEAICSHPERYHAFQFSILQVLPKTFTKDQVNAVENRWKKKLLSKQFGMNDN